MSVAVAGACTVVGWCAGTLTARLNDGVLSGPLRGDAEHEDPTGAVGSLVTDRRTQRGMRLAQAAATAALFGALALRFGPTAQLPALLFLGATAVALTVTDARHRRLPDRIVLPSYLVSGALLSAAAVITGDGTALLRAALAMAASFTVYLVLALVTAGGVGPGDVKLAGLLGLHLGWLGWSHAFLAPLLGFLLAALVLLPLLAAGWVHRKSQIPLGPALIAGSLLSVFAGDSIAAWYPPA